MAVLAIIQADPEPRSHYGYRSRYGQVRGYSGRYQGRNNRGYGKIQPYGSSYKGYGKKRPSVLPMAPMAMPMAPPSPKVRIIYWIYRIVASRSTSRLVTCLGLFRLLMKGIFGPYVL